jgi:DNA-binding transcriptional ArsR family regulator
MSAKSTQLNADQRLVKALGHPLRQRILRELHERTASPSELAVSLDSPLGNVSYHVKILLECEAVELVATAPVRGTIEHFYRAIVRTRLYEEQWNKLSPRERRELLDDTLNEIWGQVVGASKSGGFEDTKTYAGWVNLDLDAQAYAETLEDIEEFISRILARQAAAADRLGELAPEEREAHATELVVLHFHRPPGDSAGTT